MGAPTHACVFVFIFCILWLHSCLKTASPPTAVQLSVTLPAFDANGSLQQGPVVNSSLGPLHLASVAGDAVDSTVYLNVSLPSPVALNGSVQAQLRCMVQTRAVSLPVVLTVAVRRCGASSPTDAAALQQAGQLINLNSVSAVCVF